MFRVCFCKSLWLRQHPKVDEIKHCQCHFISHGPLVQFSLSQKLEQERRKDHLLNIYYLPDPSLMLFYIMHTNILWSRSLYTHVVVKKEGKYHVQGWVNDSWNLNAGVSNSKSQLFLLYSMAIWFLRSRLIFRNIWSGIVESYHPIDTFFVFLASLYKPAILHRLEK